jgi:hypothetical protein
VALTSEFYAGTRRPGSAGVLPMLFSGVLASLHSSVVRFEGDAPILGAILRRVIAGDRIGFAMATRGERCAIGRGSSIH